MSPTRWPTDLKTSAGLVTTGVGGCSVTVIGGVAGLRGLAVDAKLFDVKWR